ncbi:hypothetical protein MA16_Dca005875 [Dendrobium catenatum]|uniref:Afadin-and alpha-actinin-binding protein n=1 Tax=Dendrobium catenatum TaxID=906689 RepID=A0A2I0WXG5_9ASPA|nr:hypothetical protein MA16_Dca005875 [Dendrobium catenatum]
MTTQSLAFPSEVALLILQKNNAGWNIRAVVDVSGLLHCELLAASDVPKVEVAEEKRPQRPRRTVPGPVSRRRSSGSRVRRPALKSDQPALGSRRQVPRPASASSLTCVQPDPRPALRVSLTGVPHSRASRPGVPRTRARSAHSPAPAPPSTSPALGSRSSPASLPRVFGTESEEEQFLASGPPALGMGEYNFAEAGNLEHCAKYLNQTLVTFGFPASLDLFSTDPVSVARTCNCIYALLQLRQRDVEFRESSSEQRQRLQSDMSKLEAKVERLDAQLVSKDRELATLARTEAKASAAFKAQIEKLQQERDEFQKMVIGHQQARTQQLHEMKKKEKDYIKLQERLNQVLMEKKKESRSGMEIMNLLQKEGRQRGTWNGKKADGDFYKMIADAYEVKKQELMAENADLRASLRSMQDVFDLPFHIAKDQIEESLRTKMASIKARMVQLQDAQKGAEVSSEATERELELEAQLVEARSIIQEQVIVTLLQQCRLLLKWSQNITFILPNLFLLHT